MNKEVMRLIKAAILDGLRSEPVTLTVSDLSICAMEGTFDLDALARNIIARLETEGFVIDERNI